MKNNHPWIPAALSAALLAACGGGGGSSPDTSTPEVTTATVSMAGTAAKGLLAHAIVTAHAIGADGQPAAAALATAETDAAGHYSLSFTATKNQPYVIEVAAKPDGSTTQLDEVSHATQALPAGFTMRALFSTASTGPVTTRVAVTPFSEMAVAAAAAGTGGITAANAAQAITNVKSLLGFDPTAVTPTTIAAASGTEQQVFAVMLTAVSKLANDSALGCTQSDAGARTQCVVETLASASSLSSSAPGTVSGTNVSTALGDAAQAVVADPVLNPGTVDPAALTTIGDNLAHGGNTPPPAGSDATAIAAAKALFTEIRSDWTTLFSRNTATTLGAANVEANAFRAAMTGVQAPAEMMLKDAGAMLTGIDLYNDYKAGRTTNPERGRALEATASDTSALVANDFNAVGCTLYQDANRTVMTTAPGNANFIGCRAAFKVTRTVTTTGSVTTQWFHGFGMAPTGNGGFTYSTLARKRDTTCTYATQTCSNVNTNMTDGAGVAFPAVTGTVTTSVGDDPFTGAQVTGHITAFSMSGQLPGAFKAGGDTLVSDHHTWTVSGTRTFGQDSTGRAQSVSTVEGSVQAFAADGSSLGTLTVVSGSGTDTDVDLTADGSSPGDLTAAALDVVWTTATSELAGAFTISDTAYDKSGTSRTPTKVSFSGALRNKGTGTAMVDFASGTMSVSLGGYGNYDATQAHTTSNDFTESLSFVASITAPGRPKLEISGSSTANAVDDAFRNASLQYRTVVDGAEKMVIGIAITGAQGTTPGSVKVSEAASGLSMVWTDGAASAALVYNNTLTVGTLDKSTKVLTFTNGDFVSVDLGL